MRWNFSPYTTFNPDDDEVDKYFRSSPHTTNIYPYKCKRCGETIVGVFERYTGRRLSGEDICGECQVKEIMTE